MKLAFSLNTYDHEGDMYEKGVYLHFDDTRVRIGTMKDFETLMQALHSIKKEIEENYPEDQIP